MTLQLPFQDQGRNIAADVSKETARTVPDLAQYLERLDADYASLPPRDSTAAHINTISINSDHDLPKEVKSAMLILILLVTSAFGLILSVLALVLGATWTTALAANITPPLVAITAWCMWMVR